MPNSSPPKLILASSSRYRRELLARLQIPFSVWAPHLDESALPNETPLQTAIRLAREKAESVWHSHGPAVIIGSDQVAALDGKPIGKPGSHANALKQLKIMQGRSVVFHTALCLLDGRDPARAPRVQLEHTDTTVTFRNLDDEQLDAYLRIEQPYDCAGSAKNEGLGIALIESIHSPDPTALTGLPLIALVTMLRKAAFVFFNAP